MSKKKQPMPWFKMYPDAYLDGTFEMTPEQRGIYSDCLFFIYKDDLPLSKNDASMAHRLRISVKAWRRVRDFLVGLGKLIETPDGYTNDRASIECEDRRERQSNKSSTAIERELNRVQNPELPLNFNAGRAKLRPQLVLHARASSDHQIEKEEESKKERGPFNRPVDDDDPYGRLRELSPRIVTALRARVGDEQADHILRVYFQSSYARDVRFIDKAFPAWIAKTYSERITEDLTNKELAAEILAMLPKGPDGKPDTALPKRVRA